MNQSVSSRVRCGPVPLVVKDFRQRDDIGQDLDSLDPELSTVLTGISGVGKTQLAADYFTTHRDSFPHSVWVDVGNNGGLTDIENLARILDLEPSSASLVERVRSFIGNSPERWLVVFDNTNSKEILSNGRVAIGTGLV